MQFFSDAKRPVHLGPYPLERLSRDPTLAGDRECLNRVPLMAPLQLRRPEQPRSITNAMADYQAMMDAIRIGITHKHKSGCPDDPEERANHIKGFGYFNDAAMVGICRLPAQARLDQPVRNPDIDVLAEALETQQTKTLSSGIDVIMADLKESMKNKSTSIDNHTHACVFLYEYPRDPTPDECGAEWIQNAQQARASIRASESAVVVAQYLRLYGFDSTAHTQTTSAVNLNVLSVAAGLASVERGVLSNPYIGGRFGVAAVTTDFSMASDEPLAARQNRRYSHGLAWKTGKGFKKRAGNHVPFNNRRFIDGEHPFEKLKRVDTTTTFIDEARVPRVPKRTDMFARALFGDLGKQVQENTRNGHYIRKAGLSMAQRRALGAFIFLQDGEPAAVVAEGTDDPVVNAQNIKATAYFLGCDAVGVSRCPDWTWYSHNAVGDVVDPPHDQAISIVIDQGYETMEGASGDDWISGAQSMRAYLRFSLLGGVIANHIRALGYSAKAHTVVDGDVLQPPLLLLSGLGEVSRIGEVILNPFLGPRLKSGVVTTTMPVAHDKPIDFGLQTFCESCNKCARECPSGAITSGPKLMFNGYEIWKSDSQRCTTYRVGTPGGAMCGRCMKTCPWNLGGLLVEKPFRWAAMNLPRTAPLLAKLDDVVDNGSLNPVKKWWWDLEWQADGSYQPTEHPVNVRQLQKNLKLKYEDQTLAVYPAHLAPQPWPFPSPMDREKGISAYQAMISSAQYRRRLAAGEAPDPAHEYKVEGDAPVIPVVVSRAVKLTADTMLYELTARDHTALPSWQAGAHIDVVIAPEFFRQYSLCSDPADSGKYEIAVLREDNGKGGSALMHRIFNSGRQLFVSRPINHFPLQAQATKHYLMGGGIGVTPMIAMAHEAYRRQQDFELHYSVSSRDSAAFIALLEQAPWSEQVTLYISDEGTRADISQIIGRYVDGCHVYTCGPDSYMTAVLSAALQQGYPEESCHREYFHVPDVPDYENKPFSIRLKSTGQTIVVPVEKSIADVLNENGVTVDIKCSDGICGVCRCGLIGGQVEHRDYVLSKKQRESNIITCQSRAIDEGDILELDV